MVNLAKNYEVNEISISYKSKKNVSELEIVNSSVTARDYVYPLFDEFVEHHEEMWAILLNRANKCLGVSKISQGGINETVVDVRIIMQAALLASASGIILIHNHPSGIISPSVQDDSITRQAKQVCQLFNIPLLDHMIITSRLFYSYADEGHL